MTEKAVIDRFESNYAVLLIGEEGRRLEVPRNLLPKNAKAGVWLQVEFDGKELIQIKIDQEATERAKKRIAEKLASLRRGDHLK